MNNEEKPNIKEDLRAIEKVSLQAIENITKKAKEEIKILVSHERLKNDTINRRR